MSLRLSDAGLRRRTETVRASPDWDRVPEEFHDEAPPAKVRRLHLHGWQKLWMALVAGVVVGLPLWIAFRDADSGGMIPPAPKPASTVVDVELPPPPPQSAPEDIPTDPVVKPPPETPVAPSAATPSVGLVSTGPSGGSGNGVPGLDLGLEGKPGAGMAVASGGGGSGGGSGTGTGTGIGSQRFVYQPGQVDQDARPSGALSEPAYPRRADEDGIEAMVDVRLLIDERGRVEEMEVLGAPAGYGFEAALKKVSSRWHFEPARLGGVPVPQWVRLPWHFKRPD